MLNRIANFFVRIVERWMPDPFLFCVLLTLLCYLLALGFTSTAPLPLIGHWYDGLWEILPFTMQMILVLLTGYTLASSAVVRRGLEWIAGLPQSQGSAIVVLTLASALGALLHWGFALVAAALLARAMGRKVKNCDFGFLVAGAYSGFVIWGSGLSGSIALVSATEGSEMNLIARHTSIAAVPLSQTLGSPMNLALIAGTLVLMPLMFRLMMPRGDQIRGVDPALLAEHEDPTAALPARPTPAERLEHSRVLLYVLAGFGVVFLARHFWTRGFALDLNVVILLFLVLGMLLHGRPVHYLRAFNQAARVAGPLVLQYPLYGGIMGMMAKSGLADELSRLAVATSNETTFPWLVYLSASVLNLFIPSGGGQWAVQGPLVIPAAAELGVSPAVAAMAVAFGDQTTNMLQPFWALPVLAIARLKIRDIMGYCVMTCLLSFALTTLVLFLLA